MSSKVLNTVLTCLFMICLMASQANATLIVGSTYEDEVGVQWEYLGSFDLASGPHWDGATPFNGLEAAEFIFGSSVSYQYALSSFLSADIENNVHGFGVNHMAWYDSYDLTTGLHEASESVVANVSGTSTYDANGDVSAYINDRAWAGENINHVFKSITTSVPEPSTLAIFALALVGLASRRLKR